jgi:hypothetical protein
MMPNRILKESICTSENLNSLSQDEEVFFYRLMVNCDDFGRLDGRATILRAKCFPLKIDTITDAEIEQWLTSLIEHELIVTYSVNDYRYLSIVTWEDHQQVRAKRSKYPSPNGHSPASDNMGNQPQSDDSKCPRNPIQSLSLSESNTHTKLNKLFDMFWNAYPKKKSKGQAEKVFARIKPDDQLLAVILAAIEQASKSDDWLKDSGTFIPYPATWLNARGWEDEIKQEKSDGKGGRHPRQLTPRDKYTPSSNEGD